MSSRSEPDLNPEHQEGEQSPDESELNTSRQAHHSDSDTDDDDYDLGNSSRSDLNPTLNLINLLRSTAAGGRRMLLAEMPSSSDSEDDPDFVPPTRPKPPPRKFKPDTSRISSNEIRLLTSDDPSISIPQALRKRAIGHQHKRKLTSHMLPQYQTRLAKFKNKVFCGVYGRDGDIFVSACQDRRIRIYDTAGGSKFKLVQNFQARDVGWSVLDVALSPDGQYVVYSSWNNFLFQIKILDESHCPTAKPRSIHDKRPKLESEIEEEKRLSTEGESAHQLALCLDPQENQQHQFCIFSLRFSQDSKEILGGANDGRIYVYNRETNCQGLNIAAHHYSDVNAVCFVDETTHILASGSDDGIVKVWDRRELRENYPKPVGQLAGHRDGIAYLDPRGDGRYLLSNSKDQSIKLWDIRKFTPEGDVDRFAKEVRRLHWDYRWECVPKQMKYEIKKMCEGDTSVMTYRGHSVLQTLIRAHFSPVHSTGQRYIYTGCATGLVIIYDLLTGETLQTVDGHSACVRDVSWHPYYPTIISSSWDATISRWDYGMSHEKDDRKDQDEDYETKSSGKYNTRGLKRFSINDD